MFWGNLILNFYTNLGVNTWRGIYEKFWLLLPASAYVLEESFFPRPRNRPGAAYKRRIFLRTNDKKMADLFFPNDMPDFVQETPVKESAVGSSESPKDSLTRLLHLPYKTISERLKKEALDLKETVPSFPLLIIFRNVWLCIIKHKFMLDFFGLLQIVKETWGGRGKRVNDYTLYTGALGTALLLFKAYQVTKNQNDLARCSEIIRACRSASQGSGYIQLPPPTSFSLISSCVSQYDYIYIFNFAKVGFLEHFWISLRGAYMRIWSSFGSLGN